MKQYFFFFLQQQNSFFGEIFFFGKPGAATNAFCVVFLLPLSHSKMFDACLNKLIEAWDPRNADSFSFSTEVPLGDVNAPVVGGIAYLIVVAVVFFMTQSHERYELKEITIAHNLFLCLWSLAMFLGVSYGMYVSSLESGFYSSLLCAPPQENNLTGPLGYWLYVYYLSKYYEFLDTILAILKKKPLTFLHVYHHAIIPVLSWTWLAGNWPFQFIGAWLNTLIHVIMYYYYFARTVFGYNPWWKSYITTGQILQFFIVFLMIFGFLFMTTRTASLMELWNGNLSTWEGDCAGNLGSVVLSQLVNITFLGLFTHFYIQTYTKKRK